MINSEVSQVFSPKCEWKYWLPFKMGKARNSMGHRCFSALAPFVLYTKDVKTSSWPFQAATIQKQRTSQFVFLSRKIEASTRSQFDQEHKLPEKKRSSPGLTKFSTSARHLRDQCVNAKKYDFMCKVEGRGKGNEKGNWRERESVVKWRQSGLNCRTNWLVMLPVRVAQW